MMTKRSARTDSDAMSDGSPIHLGAQGAPKPDFFSEHPEFFETSQTGAHPNRLRARHRAIIEHNVAIIAKRSILDIASHDGRWSHTLHHHFLVQQFGRIGAQHVIVDTVIWPNSTSGSFKNQFLREWIETTPNECVIRLGQENPAIELLFGDQGFTCTYYNWHDGSTKDWTALTDYGLKERVTFVASRKADTP